MIITPLKGVSKVCTILTLRVLNLSEVEVEFKDGKRVDRSVWGLYVERIFCRK